MASEHAMAFEKISREDPEKLIALTAEELRSRGIAPIKREFLFRPKPQAPPSPDSSDAEDGGKKAHSSRGNGSAQAASAEPPAPAGEAPAEGAAAGEEGGDGGEAEGCDGCEGGEGEGGEEGGKKRKGKEQGGKGRRKRERLRAAVQEKPARGLKMCFAIALGDECLHGERCHFSHDVAAYLARKPPDLGPVCRHFEASGKCPYGILCRYGGAHIREGKNVVDEAKLAAWKDPLLNVFSRDLQTRLRKKQLSFARSEKFIAEWDVIMRKRNGNVRKGAAPELQEGAEGEAGPAGEEPATQEPGAEAAEEEAGPSTQEPAVAEAGAGAGEAAAAAGPSGSQADVDQGSHDREARLRPAEKRKVDFAGLTYLAPLTTVGNTPFRRVCRDLGVDITCGEMAMGPNLLQGQNSEWALLRRHTSERIFGAQLCGSVPELMAKVAELIENHVPDIDFVDLNCGCPIDIVVNRGGGSALMQRPQRFEGIVRGMSSVLSCPLTVKMRTGWDNSRPVAHKFAPLVAQWGASAVTIHGRSRLQRYHKLADWEYIARVAEGTPVPVIGNGDILGWEDYWAHMEGGKLATCMVARGALIKPWIFTEIKERRTWDISAGERLDLYRNFVNYGLDHWGSDDKGVENTRRFLLEWLSYACRYIPAGLLELLPQRMNDRVPKFCARGDLEGLLSSEDSRDWAKISEMLLGPVPDGFHFTPKHKSSNG